MATIAEEAGRPTGRPGAPVGEPPSVGEAAERVRNATLQLVEDRLDLLRLDAMQKAEAAARTAVAAVVLAVMGLIAWLLLNAAAYAWSQGALDVAPSLALLALAGGNLVLGAVAFFVIRPSGAKSGSGS